MNHRIPEELIEFIKESPTAFHAVSAMAARLTESGFIRLEEGMHWNLKQGGSYYVTRNDSSLIAFTIPEHPFQGTRRHCRGCTRLLHCRRAPWRWRRAARRPCPRGRRRTR